MELALANTRKRLEQEGILKPMIDQENYDIFIIYFNPGIKEVVEYLFCKVKEEYKGTRNVKIVNIEEYTKEVNECIREVDDEDSEFNVIDFYQELGKKSEDVILVYSHALESTQAFLQKYCKDYQNIVCTTDIQTQGRGRSSNAWVSPVGCLMFSFKSALQNSDFIGLMQYLEAVVMCEALEEFDELKGMDINIKWPNDVYIKKKLKICGILCQSIYSGGVFDITSGIGINVSNRKPTTCLEEEVYIDTKKRVSISRGRLLGKFMRIWIESFGLFSQRGVSCFIDRYYHLWLHTNQNVNVINENNTIESVIIRGINENGYLQAVNAKGTIVELVPDGNSFNFFEGLISKKE